MKASVPPGASTRRNSASAWSRSGRWCSTAWPSTRSNESSANGSGSASACAGLDLQRSSAAVAPSRSSIPGEMSVAVASPITPCRSRLSVK